MKCKTMKHGNIGLQCMMLAFIFAVCFSSCNDDKDATSAPYDPNQPVEVTDFTPKSGGGKKKMIIYGSNFGIDCSIISVNHFLFHIKLSPPTLNHFTDASKMVYSSFSLSLS